LHIRWDDEVSTAWKHAIPVTIKTHAIPIIDNPAAPRINVVGESRVLLQCTPGIS
jgi:hypothetical protein